MELKIEISIDGIAIFDGFFSENLCQNYIKYFEELNNSGFALDRWTSEKINSIKKDDLAVSFKNGSFLTTIEIKENSIEFLNIFWEQCYSAYVKKFSIIKNFAAHKIYNFQIQKTSPSQGYHVWHCETGSRDNCNRIMAFILYLNDIEDGGETEFLYLRRRVAPKTGRLLLWPSGYSHTHRGNPPLTTDKYILTGWVEF